eukprot:XP_781085.3 PREDICTED: scavenger receptor cysteine-rich type 1 protein M130 [Strongylocentrotus purpuratus]
MIEWRMVSSVFLLPILLVLLGATLSQGDLRLQNSDSYSGRLEVLYNGEWGTVCDLDFGDEEARVACRELGLDTTEYQTFDASKFGEGNGTIWLAEVNCNGWESTLDSCAHNSYGVHSCSHSMDVGLTCGEYVEPGELRLENGDDRSGRLEIFYNGQWGTVCNDNFGEDEARVACQQLNLDSSSIEQFGSSKYGEGTGMIWLDEVNCNGIESTLDSCAHDPYGYHDCSHSEDVGISCGTEGNSESGNPFLGGIGRWMGSIVFVCVASVVCGASMYRRRQLYLMRQQQGNNGTNMVHVPPPSNNPGATPFPTQPPPQQSGEPRPYPVQTYSPAYPPASTGGAPPANPYPVQAYPPPGQYPTQLPPVEGSGPYPPQGDAAPYLTPQSGETPPAYQLQGSNMPEGDLPPPPSYNDIVKQ